jgi:hypothetical protein
MGSVRVDRDDMLGLSRSDFNHAGNAEKELAMIPNERLCTHPEAIAARQRWRALPTPLICQVPAEAGHSSFQ